MIFKRTSVGTAFLAGVLVVLVSSGGIIESQGDDYLEMVSRIREEGLHRSHVMDYAWYLSDVVGPRLIGTENLREAQVWAEGTMDSLGLSNITREHFGEPVVSWEPEYISLHMMEPDYVPLIGYPEAFTLGTDGPITGSVKLANIRSRDDLVDYRGQLRNSIVLSTSPRDYAPRFTPDALRHDEESLGDFVVDGIDRNILRRRQEAWALNPTRPKGLTRSELESFYRSEGVAAVLVAAQGGDGTVFVGSRNDRSIEAVKASLPTVSLAAEHYGRIYRLVERGISVKLKIDMRVSLAIADEPESNVLGELPGSDRPDELVMIGAHLDSWHTGVGATDNASGVAVVLEAMRLLKVVGATPRRTIRAALWGHEEGGLKGSRAYVASHFGNPIDGTKADYDNFSVYFNVDNGTGQIRGVHQQGNLSVGGIFRDWMRPFNDLGVQTLSIFSNLGSDQLAFDEVGLPGFQFLQDRIDYRTRTHHTNMDMFEKLIPDDLKINAVVLAGFAYRAAQIDERIPRKPFKESGDGL